MSFPIGALNPPPASNARWPKRPPCPPPDLLSYWPPAAGAAGMPGSAELESAEARESFNLDSVLEIVASSDEFEKDADCACAVPKAIKAAAPRKAARGTDNNEPGDNMSRPQKLEFD